MALTLRSVGQSTPASSGTSQAITKPSGLAVGDLMIAHVFWRNGGTISTPTGWTLIVNIVRSTTNTMSAFWKIATSGDVSASTFTFTASGSVGNVGQIYAFSAGFDSTTPVDQHNTGSYAAGAPLISAITPTNANSTIMTLWGAQNDAAMPFSAFAIATSDPGSWTHLGSSGNATSNCAIDAAFSAVRSQTTSTGSATASETSSIAGVGIMVNINPVSNVAPTVVLNSPANASSGSDTTPDLTFTGTDANSDDIRYELQADTVNTFDSHGGGSPSIADSYSETNQNTTSSTSSTTVATGQSFTGDGNSLYSAKFYIEKTGSPTGNLTAKVYAHTGTYGTNSIGTGSVLATSDNFDISTLTTSFQVKELLFSGVNRIPLSSSTKYVVVLDASGITFSGGTLVMGIDSTSPTHAGNFLQLISGAWSGNASFDVCFYIYTIPLLTPLLDKVSGTDSGFVDVTNGADTDPFASGDQITFTPQGVQTIALDATSSGRNSTGSGLTIAHTISGVDRVLYVMTSVQDGNHANYPITVCTYNGISLTKVRSDEATGNNRTEIWRLIAPPTGTHNIIVSAAGTLGELAIIGVSLTGADQTAPEDANTGTSGNSSTPSVSITSVSDNAWFLTMASAEATFSSNGTGQTTIATLTDQSFENARGTYEGPQTPAGSDTQSFVIASGQSWALSSVAVKPKASDALAANTYYWRVAGTDPLGTNTYGAWSSTRSFTINTTTTTDQTVSAVSRITVSTPKTESAISRVTAKTPKTESAVANISTTVTTTKTETGTARVTISTVKTETGITRVTATTPKTETAVSRVRISSSKTASAIARITAKTTKTESALSRITATTSKTAAGTSRVTVSTGKTETATARITIMTSKTETALSRLTVSTPQAEAAKAAIKQTTARTEAALSRVTQTVPKTASAIARLTISSAKTEAGLSRVTATSSKTAAAKASVQRTTSQTESALARVTVKTPKTETAVTRLTVLMPKTVSALSRLTALTPKTALAKAAIKQTTIQTETGKTRVTIVTPKTETAISNVVAGVNHTETAIARITAKTTKTESALSRLTTHGVQTETAIARVGVTASRTETGQTRITATSLKTEAGKASVVLTELKTESAVASVSAVSARSLSGAARILDPNNPSGWIKTINPTTLFSDGGIPTTDWTPTVPPTTSFSKTPEESALWTKTPQPSGSWSN